MPLSFESGHPPAVLRAWPRGVVRGCLDISTDTRRASNAQVQFCNRLARYQFPPAFVDDLRAIQLEVLKFRSRTSAPKAPMSRMVLPWHPLLHRLAGTIASISRDAALKQILRRAWQTEDTPFDLRLAWQMAAPPADIVMRRLAFRNFMSEFEG